MRAIDPTAGPLTVLSLLGVLSNRLAGRPDTRPLASEVNAARLELKRRHDVWAECNDAAIAATGSVVFADEVEDDEIAGLARRWKVEVDGQLRSEKWIRLFSRAPSELTRGLADETQAQLADHVIDTITTNGDYASVRDLLPDLQAARSAVIAARLDRVRCEKAEAEAWNEVQIAEHRCREVYRDTEPKLELLFPGRGRLVASFFYRKPKSPQKTKPTADGAGPAPERIAEDSRGRDV